MELKDYSIEELRAEIKRRSEVARAERDKVKRCRMCAHFGSVDYWGRPVKERTFPSPNSCPFWKTKNGKYYRCHNRSDKACEYFKEKEV